MEYIISYDIMKEGDAYRAAQERVQRALQAMGARRILLSVWVLTSNSTPDQLMRTLKIQCDFDSNDRILVAPSSGWKVENRMFDLSSLVRPQLGDPASARPTSPSPRARFKLTPPDPTPTLDPVPDSPRTLFGTRRGFWGTGR